MSAAGDKVLLSAQKRLRKLLWVYRQVREKRPELNPAEAMMRADEIREAAEERRAQDNVKAVIAKAREKHSGGWLP